MAMDLAALTALMGDQGANKTAQDELTTRMSEANALRGSTPEASKSLGFVSPLDVVSSIMNRSRGNKQKAELQPQLQAASRSVNDLASAKQQYGLNLAADKVRQDQTNFEGTAAAKVQSALVKAMAEQEKEKTRVAERGADQALAATTLEDELAVDAQDEATRVAELGEKQGIEAGKREGIMKINPETKEAESLTVDDQGILRRNGEVVDNPASWKDYKEPTGGQGSKDFKSPSPAQQKDLEKAGNDMLQLNTVVDSYKPSYAGGSIPLGGSASNFIARNAPIAATPAMEESQNWWASYDLMYTLPERNTLFGGALTGGEAASWEKNAISPNMTDAQIQPRLKELQRIKAAVTARMRESAKLKGWNTPWIDANLAPEDEAAAEEPAGTNRLKTRNDSPDLASLEAQLAELLEKKRRREAGG